MATIQLKNYTLQHKLTLDTSATGANTQIDQIDVPVPIHISHASFTEATARADFFSPANVGGKRHNFYMGNDALRPLSYQVLKWDAGIQEAIFFVKIPRLIANSVDGNILYITYTAADGSWPVANQDRTRDVWSNNFVGVFHLNDNLADSLEVQNLINLNTTSVNTRMDKGRGFTGATGMYTGHSDSYIFTSQGSISLLLKHPDTLSLRTLVDKWNESAAGDDTSAVAGGYRLSISADGKLQFDIGDADGVLTKTSTVTIDDNVEHHLASTLENCSLRTFVDGVEN